MTTPRGRKKKDTVDEAATEGLLFGGTEPDETDSSDDAEETVTVESSADEVVLDSSDADSVGEVAADPELADPVAELETEETPAADPVAVESDAVEDVDNSVAEDVSDDNAVVDAESEVTATEPTTADASVDSVVADDTTPVADTGDTAPVAYTEDVVTEEDTPTEDNDTVVEDVAAEPVLSPAPDALMAYQVGANDVRLAWADDHGNTVWRLYRSPAFVGRSFMEVTKTSYVDRGLARGQTYFYHVVSMDSNEIASAPSTSITYTVR